MWTKPLGDGRTAALFVNTAEKDATTARETFLRVAPEDFAAVTTAADSYERGGGLSLSKCDPEKPSQLWAFETGGALTNVKS